MSRGGTPEPEGGKVTGADGKKYDAAQPPKPEPILCDRCKRDRRVGNEPVKKCQECAELHGKKGGKAAAKPKAGKPKFNDKKFEKVYGPLVRLVDERGNALGKDKHHKRCQELLGLFLAEYKEWMKVS